MPDDQTNTDEMRLSELRDDLDRIDEHAGLIDDQVSRIKENLSDLFGSIEEARYQIDTLDVESDEPPEDLE